MKSYNLNKDIRPLIKNVKSVIESHKIQTGVYARWIWDDPSGKEKREYGVINEYGCADAANLLYTIGDFPKDSNEREMCIKALKSMQNEENGLFEEKTHNTLHTTAHCIAALELFDTIPEYPLKGLDKYKTKEGLYELLEGLRWADSPWNNSHMGAGIYASLNLAGEASSEWNDWYFEWFRNEADPETGMWRKGYPQKGLSKLYTYMAASFHYLFNHEYARMPLMYPEKMIDSCLYMYKNDGLPLDFCKRIDFLQIDWVYCITRSLRQCGHRFDECKETIAEFSDKYIDYLLSIDPEVSDMFNDLHMLFGAVCCVAELQQFLPGCIQSEKPLKLVLDRRPFI